MVESTISLTLATFTPGETEKVTGVSQAIQRDWRRRELTSFATRKGRKRFSSADLAHLIVMKQLLAQVRPAVAYLLARQSTGAINILAVRLHPSGTIKLEGTALNRNALPRFAVFRRHMDGQEGAYFTSPDLNSLVSKTSRTSTQANSKRPVAFYVVVDLSEIADQLQLKQIKPYFIPLGQKD